MASIGTRIHTWFAGKLVGADSFGNRYYQAKTASEDGKFRRWVLYKGIVEASKVPPLWHSWLHYNTDTVPLQIETYDWQKTPQPNLTGTTLAYRPEGHITKGGKRQKATGDYQAWSPGE